MKELLYTHCSWCLRSMEGIEENEAFALAKPLSERLKASARRSATSFVIPLAGKEIPTLFLGQGDAATAQWLLCRQECSDALTKALEEEFRPSFATQPADREPRPNATDQPVDRSPHPDIGMRHPLTLSIDAHLMDRIKSKAVLEQRDLTDITEELYRQYLTQRCVPDLGTDLLRD